MLANPLAKHIVYVVVHWDYGFGTIHGVAELGVTSLLPASRKTTILVEILDKLAFFHALTRTLR